jgi:EAL domain-containing protein (putative c-di-GMP-specific phosphodiesterase class I)
VHPKLLISVNEHGKVFERILHANSVITDRIVIEIQEALIDHDLQLTGAINNYRDRGYRIAIDRFGSNQSHIDRLWKLTPDFVKLDLNLIQQAETDKRVRSALPGLIKIIKDLGAKPIVTGIETQGQLDIALESGSSLFQGYFLAKPVTAKELQPSALFKRSVSAVNIRAA